MWYDYQQDNTPPDPTWCRTLANIFPIYPLKMRKLLTSTMKCGKATLLWNYNAHTTLITYRIEKIARRLGIYLFNDNRFWQWLARSLIYAPVYALRLPLCKINQVNKITKQFVLNDNCKEYVCLLHATIIDLLTF